MRSITPIVWTLLILAGAVIAFISNRVPVAVVATGVSISLWAAGVLDVEQAFAGFGDPTVVFIAALFVVSAALESTGVTAWAGQQVLKRGISGRNRLLVVLAVLVAGLTALISVNGAVAAILPVAVVVSLRSGIEPSKVLMPLAFFAHAGSLLLLTGTPLNILVTDAAVEAGDRGFGFFEFALAGLPLLTGTILIIVLFGDQLLPSRPAPVMTTDLSTRVAALRKQYDLAEGTDLIGARSGVLEVVLPPRSELIGEHLFPGMLTPSGDLVVLGVQRGEQDLTGPDTLLQAGDTLLVQGTWAHLEKHTAGPEVLVVDDPAAVRRSVPLGAGAKRAIGILVAMILLLGFALVPPAIAAAGAAMAIVVTGVLTPAQAFNSISWTTVVLVAGMIPLSTAFSTTGTADLITDGLLAAVGSATPRVALAAVCLITLLLGQMISNTATVLVMIPSRRCSRPALGYRYCRS